MNKLQVARKPNKSSGEGNLEEKEDPTPTLLPSSSRHQLPVTGVRSSCLLTGPRAPADTSSSRTAQSACTVIRGNKLLYAIICVTAIEDDGGSIRGLFQNINSKKVVESNIDENHCHGQ